jgi:hypothetical protein
MTAIFFTLEAEAQANSEDAEWRQHAQTYFGINCCWRNTRRLESKKPTQFTGGCEA